MASRKQNKSRLIVVTNRGPYHFRKTTLGVRDSRTIGGLVSALDPLLRDSKGVWVAWGDESDIANIGTRVKVPLSDPTYLLKLIRMSDDEISNFYYGFSNNILWPLCHYFPEKCNFAEKYWKYYQQVNQKFAEAILEELNSNDIIWIHDYHLALVPQYIRQKKPKAKVGIFWHIPFPAPDVFNMLPWSKEIVQGLLHADLVGFHTPRYVNNFLETALSQPEVKVDRKRGICLFHGKTTKIKNFPISIDAKYIEWIGRQPKSIEKSRKIKQNLRDTKLILGVDRLDYSKGILERLLSIELFFEKYSEQKGKVTFLQIAVPSRTKINNYRIMKREIEEAVGRINGRLGSTDWMPIYYFYKGFSFEELISYYMAADIALLTPLRDGMNLVAKEYVAAQQEDTGVLILSKFTGSAEELKNALIINPYNAHEVADTLMFALRLNDFERREQMKIMRRHIFKHDVFWWVNQFLKVLK